MSNRLAPPCAAGVGSKPAGVGSRDPRRLPAGIHFGLDQEAYHADPALGSSDLRRLAHSAADYWHHSALNPDRPETDSEAKLWGRAFHALTLEGPAAFRAAYAMEPEKEAQGPGLLVTLDDLKAVCRDLDEKVSGSKAELAARIRARRPEAPIWDDIVAAFEADARARGATVLKPRLWREVEAAAGAITANPHLARAFEAGIPEVSVIWEERGLRLKARLDYLKPRAVIDLKAVSNPFGQPLEDCVRQAFNRYRLDIQARHYLDGYAALLAHAEAGRVFGHCPLEPGWQRAMAAPEDVRFTWVFHQRTGAPLSKAWDVALGNPAFRSAEADLAAAKRTYVEHLQAYGSGRWPSAEPVRELGEDDILGFVRRRAEALAEREGPA